MSQERLPRYHYQFAKINSQDRWRFYIDANRQQTKNGIEQGEKLFEDEPGYMTAMLLAHDFLNQTLSQPLTAELIIQLHQRATANVKTKSNFLNTTEPVLNTKEHNSFKNNISGKFGCSNKNVSPNGLVEFFENIINGKLPYSDTETPFMLVDRNNKYFSHDYLDEDLICKYLENNVTEPLSNSAIEKVKQKEILIAQLEKERQVVIKTYKEIECEGDKWEELKKEASKEYNDYLETLSTDSAQNDKHLDELWSTLGDIKSKCSQAWVKFNKKRSERGPLGHEINENKMYIKRIIAVDKLEQLKKKGKLINFANKFLKQHPSFYYVPPKYSHKQNKEIIERYISDYQREASSSTSKDQVLCAITKFIQSLEQLHPFSDGNCRTFVMLLLNRELIRNGFPPTMLGDPNRFDLFSIKEINREITNGWAYANKYQSPIASLNTYKSLYNKSLLHKNYSETSSGKNLVFLSQNSLNLFQKKLQTFLIIIKDEEPEKAQSITASFIETFLQKSEFPDYVEMLQKLFSEIKTLLDINASAIPIVLQDANF